MGKSIWNNFDTNEARNVRPKLSHIKPEQHNELGYTNIRIQVLQFEDEFWAIDLIYCVLGSPLPFPYVE